MDTPDGDFIDVDFLDTPYGNGIEQKKQQVGGLAAGFNQGETDSAPFAVLTHGLESTSTAPLTARMALA